MDIANEIIMYYPSKMAFGCGTLLKMAEDIVSADLSRLFILTLTPVHEKLKTLYDRLNSKGIIFHTELYEGGEPSFEDFEKYRSLARSFKANCIAGIGGGSVMDLAKIIAALLHTDTPVQSYIGNGLIRKKDSYLICIPTTSGTGSEVSPNSIMIDERDGSKKGIISPYLVPDVAYIDPELTVDLPPVVTAYTGIDALTHCIEAYTNKYAHPITDTLALEGIRLICSYLKKAVDNGSDIEARTMVALGSVYGGMCLGPVNTAAVHALAYPLGTEYKMTHGLSNAILLPFVMEFNLISAEERYAEIAVAAGANPGNTLRETAKNGIDLIKKLISDCRITLGFAHYQIPEGAIPKLAKSAIQIQRLLKNNVRELSLDDIITIYKTAC